MGVVGIVAYASKHDASTAVEITQAAASDSDVTFLAVVLISQVLIGLGFLWWKRRRATR